MSSQPAVSVIVPTYNRADFLPFCVESVLNQTLPAREIIVVVDGSTDATLTALEPFEGRIRVICKSNGGKSSAVNEGVSRSQGDLIWVIDDDDVALPDALERFVAALADERYGFSYSTKYRCNSNPDGTLRPAFSVTRVPPVFGRSFAIELMKKNFLGGSAIMVRRSVHEDLGGFDETLLRSQDYEYAVRVALRYEGVKVRGGPTFCHRAHEGERGSASERFTAATRDAMWRKYDRIFIRRLYDQLPLYAFSHGTAGGSGAEVVDALLTRADVMVAHGLLDLVLDDLRSLSRLNYSGPLPEGALGVGTRIVRRFVAEEGAARDLYDAFAEGTGSIAVLFARMRKMLVPALAWRLTPEWAQRWIRRTVGRTSHLLRRLAGLTPAAITYTSGNPNEGSLATPGVREKKPDVVVPSV